MRTVPAGYDAYKIVGLSDSYRAEINMDDQKQGKDEAKYDMKEISQLETINTQKSLQYDFRKE